MRSVIIKQTRFLNMKNENKGFSLIELSIVLIIIGLLVAGITGGASLIKSAELRSVMTEARNYKMAVNAYYTSEDKLPGDGNAAGDNDGKIEHKNATAYEGLLAWEDLESKSITDFNATATTGVLTAGSSIPASKYKGSGWAMYYLASNWNALLITKNVTNITTTLVPVGLLTGANADSIDTKMDDGVISSGSVRGITTTGGTCTYSVTDEFCSLAIKIGI